VSHKLARLAVPWAALVTLALAAALGGPLYGTLFAVQALVIGLGLAGLAPRVAGRSKPAAAAASFLVLNAAAWLAFWVWASVRASRSWTKTVYRVYPAGTPAGYETNPADALEPASPVPLEGASR
jgi:hypothetical protein